MTGSRMSSTVFHLLQNLQQLFTMDDERLNLLLLD